MSEGSIIGNGSGVSALRKLMAAAVIFLAADFSLIINFFASSVDRVATGGGEGQGFYFVPVALALYYACAWFLIARRRPERDPIVVQYRPPQGVSPAEPRFIYTLTCDGRTYAAIVAGLAARGLLTVVQAPEGVQVRRAAEFPLSERNVGLGVHADPGPADLLRVGFDSDLLHDLSDEERCVFHDLFQHGPVAGLHPPRQRLLDQIGLILRRRASALYYKFRTQILNAGLLAMAIATVWMAGANGLLRTASGGFDLRLAAFLGS